MKIAMAREGKGFFGDGIELSWPVGGVREVVEVSDDLMDWPGRLRDRFTAGSIVKVDLAVNTTLVPVTKPVVMRGGSPEAMAKMAEPPGYVPAAAEEEAEEAPETASGEGDVEFAGTEPEPEPPAPKPAPRRRSAR
jgi:hypothetical protein